MPKYRFIVQSPSGKARRGNITERDEAAARTALQNAGFTVVSLQEENAIVVQTESPVVAGRSRLKPERASIIEFEESFGERLWTGFHRYFLRRETAILLAVAGVIWIVVSQMQKPAVEPSPELEYKPYKITVQVDTSGFDADTLEVRLPDIPYKKSERAGGGPQTVVLDFESAVVPEKVEVTLKDGLTETAFAEGVLSREGKNDGSFSFAPDLTPVKERAEK